MGVKRSFRCWVEVAVLGGRVEELQSLPEAPFNNHTRTKTNRTCNISQELGDEPTCSVGISR